MAPESVRQKGNDMILSLGTKRFWLYHWECVPRERFMEFDTLEEVIAYRDEFDTEDEWFIYDSEEER